MQWLNLSILFQVDESMDQLRMSYITIQNCSSLEHLEACLLFCPFPGISIQLCSLDCVCSQRSRTATNKQCPSPRTTIRNLVHTLPAVLV